jgi:hypothetical protein
MQEHQSFKYAPSPLVVRIFIWSMIAGFTLLWSQPAAAQTPDPTPLPTTQPATPPDAACKLCHADSTETMTLPSGDVIHAGIDLGVLDASVHGAMRRRPGLLHRLSRAAPALSIPARSQSSPGSGAVSCGRGPELRAVSRHSRSAQSGPSSGRGTAAPAQLRRLSRRPRYGAGGGNAGRPGGDCVSSVIRNLRTLSLRMCTPRWWRILAPDQTCETCHASDAAKRRRASARRVTAC